MGGGANRDRTDDLKLAKLALSQLSYGPIYRARSYIGTRAVKSMPDSLNPALKKRAELPSSRPWTPIS